MSLPPIRESVEIAADPAVPYALVTDVTRMGEWSPECRRCEWLDGAGPTPRPGDLFRGWNRKGHLRWSTVCEVEEADGTEFRFLVVRGALGRRTRWTYRVEPTSAGSRLTELCEPLPLTQTLPKAVLRTFVVEPLRGRRDRTDELTDDIRATLTALRRRAEVRPTDGAAC